MGAGVEVAPHQQDDHPTDRHGFRERDAHPVDAVEVFPKQLEPGKKSFAEQQLDRWLELAAEARALASGFNSFEAARSMLEVAAAYERLARAKQRNSAAS